MTTTIAPLTTTRALLRVLAFEAIHGNDAAVPVTNQAAADRLVARGHAVQLTPPTADSPATYRATTAGLIAAQTTAA